MQTILSNSDYSFVASTKKITLIAPHDTLDEERILKITNLATRAIMYDSERRTFPISVADGVVTCTYDSTGMADADTLQIVVNGVSKSTDSVQDWTAVPQNTIVKSAELNTSGTRSSIMHVQAALDTTTAHTGTQFLVQGSGSSDSDADWHTIAPFVALIGTAAADAIEDAPLAAGSTAIALTGHSLTVLGKLLFIEDGTLADSEIVMEVSQTTNEVVILDGTENAHVATTPIYNVAMEQIVTLPFAIKRVRLVVVNTYDDNGSTLVYKVRVSNATGV